MGQTNIKIASVDQVVEKINAGAHIINNGQGRYIVLNKNERGYIPAVIREELFKRYPNLDPDYVDISNQLILKPLELDSEGEPIKQLPPSFPIELDEYVLHELPIRVIESIAILENLHHIEDGNRHELSFSQAQNKDIKFNDKNKTTARTLLSLIDVTIYFLIECRHKYQKIDAEISRISLELTGLYRINRQLQQKCALYEEELIMKTLSRNEINYWRNLKCHNNIKI